jgi:hypothetical protein
MATVRNAQGGVILRSKNLAALRRYVRNAPSALYSVNLIKYPSGNGMLSLVWANGDVSETSFASWRVMLGTVNRWRGLHGARVSWEGFYYGELSPKNPLWASIVRAHAA